jgi:hypothetical protein
MISHGYQKPFVSNRFLSALDSNNEMSGALVETPLAEPKVYQKLEIFN